MKAKLHYYQITRLNQWYFYFADCFNGLQLTKGFQTKEKAIEYADDNNISFDDREMVSLFV